MHRNFGYASIDYVMRSSRPRTMLRPQSDVYYFRLQPLIRRGKLAKFYGSLLIELIIFHDPRPPSQQFPIYPTLSIKTFAIIPYHPRVVFFEQGIGIHPRMEEEDDDDREASPLRPGLIMRLRWLINRSASASDSSRAGGIAVTFVINAPLVRDIDRSTGCPFEAAMVPIAPLIAPLPRTYVTLIRTEHGASDLSMLEKRRGERETFDIETYKSYTLGDKRKFGERI